MNQHTEGGRGARHDRFVQEYQLIFEQGPWRIHRSVNDAMRIMRFDRSPHPLCWE